MYGHCPIDAGCDACVDTRYQQLYGVAASRGETWAEQIARRRRADWAPWPADSERVRLLSLARIADVSGDPRVRELLARVVVEYAARRWYRLRSLEWAPAR